MNSLANNYHRFRSLITGTALFMMAAVVLTACSSGGGGGGGADLVIEPTPEGFDFQVSVSVSSATVEPSKMFTLTAVVRNTSGASEPAPASTLTYYQSSDATIDSSDTSLGMDPIAALAVAGLSTHEITPTAPTTAGTYYYGACVPATGNELNASDNCSSGAAVIVANGWDFQVAASVSSANVGVGGSVTLTAVVSNASGASEPTPASTLTYYQSTDAIISSSDTELDTDAVAILAPGDSSSQTYSATAPAVAGTYYYGGCVPAALGEANASDNCSSGVAVTVSSGWDLQVNVSVSETSVKGYIPFKLYAVIRNASNATGPSPASTLSFYQSSDATISSSDTELDTTEVHSLAVGNVVTRDINITLASPFGTYYFGACVPTADNEVDVSNNCSSGMAVTFTSAWNFQVTTSVSSGSVSGGDSVTLSAVVSNASNASEPSPSSTLTFYQSSDATIDSSDTSLDTDAVAALAVGNSSTHNISVMVPTTAGIFYYGACMPATDDEADASDNCSTQVSVTVTSGWDFRVAASVSHASVTGSQSFTLTAEVSNASSASGSAPTSTLTYYQSSDATISSSDTSLDTDAVAALAVGNSSTHSISVSIFMASGTYYYGACMPAASGEAVASDNCSSGAAVTVASGWNFEVSLEASSTTVEVGETFTLTAVVHNSTFLANEPTPAATLTYEVRPVDTNVTTTIGTDPVAILAVGESSTQTFNATAAETAGTYIYLACMPTSGDDLDVAGNCSSSLSVTVTEASGS